MFLIGIAVGTLAGSGFLHLIPQAFGITEDTRYNLNSEYVYKGLVMMTGVYLFYIVEKVLKIMIHVKKVKRSISKKNTKDSNETNSNPLMLESIGYLKTQESEVEQQVYERVHINEAQRENRNHHGHSHHHFDDISSVAPVAWMIIFGDGLHNFIDGLSIGAAFTDTVLNGVSISLAVMMEEFPHELGDFAILINAGMSYPVALLFNFLSACCCFIGLAVGITLGENFGANKWIYAIAGGMFLYIALCDMIPELNEMGDQIERDYLEEKLQKRIEKSNRDSAEEKQLANKEASFDVMIKIKILIIQNLAILFGFSFMLIMAIYSDHIKF
jgi:zinc transporter ZupT